MRLIAAIAGVGVLLAAPALLAEEDRELEFPKDYREKFTRYYSGDRLLEEEQTIVLYANDVALKGLREDGSLPSGSVLVADLYQALKDEEGEVVESALGRRVPSKFKAVAVMERREGWDDQYSDELKVGDWEFEVFSEDGKNLGKDVTACRECHHPLEDTEFLFSIEHLKAAL